MQTELFEKIDEQTIRCTACSKYCHIRNGDVGLCGVRKNENGKLNLLVYGKAAAVHIDPIEKKPLYHFLPNSKIFSLGTLGCNFGCEFCQNWDISQAARDLKRKLIKQRHLETLGAQISEYGIELSPQQVVKYTIENNIPSIAYTYNEPTIFIEYNLDIAKLAKENGLKNVYVSNGFASEESIRELAPYLDAINIDLKSFSEEFYHQVCKASLQPVLDGIKSYFEKGVWVEITTLLIPGQNDSTEELEKIAKFIYSISDHIPWHISKFHPAYKMTNISPTSQESLLNAYKIGKEVGLKYVYVGNIYDNKLHSTYCPSCNNLLVDRDWDYTKVIGLSESKCIKCGELIEGNWF